MMQKQISAWSIGLLASMMVFTQVATAQTVEDRTVKPFVPPPNAPVTNLDNATSGKAPGDKPADVSDPNDPELRERLLKDLYDKLAKAPDKSSAKQYAGAIERLWTKSGSDTVDLLMNRSLQAAGSKKTELAFELLDALTDLEPRYTEGWNRRAYLHFSQKNYGKALADLQRVLAIDPNHFKAIEGVYALMRHYEDKKSALAALRILKKVYPHWPGGEGEDELAREVEGQPISFER